MKVAVLALQGAFVEHEDMLHSLGVDTIQIRQLSDLNQEFDGLIIPGGESTVQGKLLRDLDLFKPLQDMINNGLPVFGTCAGMILLAKEIVKSDTKHLASMNIKVMRNAYGRQLGSFYVQEDFKGIGNIPMTFIRGPYIVEVGSEVEVLGCVDGKIVAARQANQLVTSFHPELNTDLSVHRYFINMINEKNG